MSTPDTPHRSRVSFTARRPRRVRRPLRPLAAAAVALTLGAAGLAAVALPEPAPGPSTPTNGSVETVAPPATAGPDGSTNQSTTPVVAQVGRTQLVLPSPAVTFIGFHEAASTDALALTIAAPLTTDLTSRTVEVSADARSDLGVRPVVTLPSRGRSADPASAIDLVLPADTEVLAPVTGTVVEVERYALYRRHPDVKIGIVPDVSPSHQVSIIHLEDPTVAVGDRVEAGRTVIAHRPNVLPFGSQVDRFTTRHGGRPSPHVHVEVKPHRR